MLEVQPPSPHTPVREAGHGQTVRGTGASSSDIACVREFDVSNAASFVQLSDKLVWTRTASSRFPGSRDRRGWRMSTASGRRLRRIDLTR